MIPAYHASLPWPLVLALWCIHFLLCLWVTVDCLKNQREPASTMLWILIAWSLPFLGPLIYLAFGVDRLPAKAFKKRAVNQKLFEGLRARDVESMPLAYWRTMHDAGASDPEPGYSRALNAALNSIVPHHPLLEGNSITPLVTGDQAFPAIFDAITRADHHVNIQSFIIQNDPVGHDLMELLAKKAGNGTIVRILFDRFGSTGAFLTGFFRKYSHIPNFHISGWTQANILKRQFQINLRNHRKIIVIDGTTAFLGGINIQKQNITRGPREPLRDYHFMIRGPAVHELQYTFLRDWHFMTAEDPDRLLDSSYFPDTRRNGESRLRIINNGPSSRKDVLTDSIFTAITMAQKQVIVITPYFVPPNDIIRALRSAAMRGVDVKIILPGRNNHFYAGLASRSFYEDLLAAGVRIFERRPPFMHAKALIIDNEVAIVGTANLDMRSLNLNYETNVIVFDPVFSNDLKRTALDEISASREITADAWLARPVEIRMLENFCRLLMPVL